MASNKSTTSLIRNIQEPIYRPATIPTTKAKIINMIIMRFVLSGLY